MISKPLLIGGAVVAVGALILLTSGSSKAAQEPAGPGPLPPAPRPPEVLPPISGPTGGVQTPLTPTTTPGLFVSGATGTLLHAAGYSGPGDYEVLAPNGLNLRARPSASAPIVSYAFVQGTIAIVAGPPDANGWVAATDGASEGFLCLSCPQAPGGPWLARLAE